MAKSNPFTLADLEAKGYVVDDTGAYVKLTTIVTVTSTADVDKSNIKLKKSSRPKAKIIKDKPEGLQAIERVLKAANIDYTPEFKFSEHRKFRFDLAFWYKSKLKGEIKVGVEYEGLMSAKSRHTTKTGFTGDCEKYNLCQIEGWIILRYTALNYKNFVEDLKKLL